MSNITEFQKHIFIKYHKMWEAGRLPEPVHAVRSQEIVDAFGEHQVSAEKIEKVRIFLLDQPYWVQCAYLEDLPHRIQEYQELNKALTQGFEKTIHFINIVATLSGISVGAALGALLSWSTSHDHLWISGTSFAISLAAGIALIAYLAYDYFKNRNIN